MLSAYSAWIVNLPQPAVEKLALASVYFALLLDNLLLTAVGLYTCQLGAD